MHIFNEMPSLYYLAFAEIIFMIILVSRVIGQRFNVVPVAILCLIFSITIDQLEIFEGIHIPQEINKNFALIGLTMISMAMFQIGLEVTDFGLLKKLKFWLFISLIVVFPGSLCFFINDGPDSLLQCLANGLLLFTSSLAVVAVFVQRQPELFHNTLVKNVMVTGVTTDILLWIGIGVLETLKKGDSNIVLGILPQVSVILFSLLIVVLGKVWWWSKVSTKTSPFIWLLLGGITAFAFYKAGLSPVLGGIFGGLFVPESLKHQVSHKLTPVFNWAMLIYMSTVGFKVHDFLSFEAVKIALLFILVTTIGKGIAIYFGKSFFCRSKFLQTMALLGNPGTMGIAAASTLSYDGIISQSVFEGMVIVAIFYTVLAGGVLKKNPISGNNNCFRLCGNFLKLNYFSL